jgi:hypothetical protein
MALHGCSLWTLRYGVILLSAWRRSALLLGDHEGSRKSGEDIVEIPAARDPE